MSSADVIIVNASQREINYGSPKNQTIDDFYRSKDTYDDLTKLKGKRVAIGPEGSGVRKYSFELLNAAGVSGPPANFLDLLYVEANRALLGGKVDTIMTFGAPDNELILELLKAKDIKLMNMSQAEAYTLLFPDLSHVVLPRGVIDPEKQNPPSDVHLLSPTTNLIVRKERHPALVYLLLKTAVEIHGGPSWVNKAGEFPAITKQDDPISEQAQWSYKSGGSWLYVYLTFWAANFVERVSLILIPPGIIIVPMIGILPWIYTWRNRSKYYPWYRELRQLEKEILANGPIENRKLIKPGLILLKTPSVILAHPLHFMMSCSYWKSTSRLSG